MQVPAEEIALRMAMVADQGMDEGSAEQGSGRTVHDTSRTLYVGNLHPFVTEAVLADVFGTLGQGCYDEIKIVRCKVTGLSAGYGFVQFTDPRYAEAALSTLHGRILYGQELRLNWTFASKQQEDTSSHFQIFVGDLGSDVNHKVLLDAFATECPNCSDARVMWDHTSGRSKGYGFVSFRSKEDAAQAIELMNGKMIGSRRVRCGWAQHKQEEVQSVDEQTVDKADPSNTNVYVGNLPPGVADAELKQMFSEFGRVVETKMYRKGGYGFVRFSDHQSAVRAIVGMNGNVVRERPIKCSWGRFPNGQRVKQGPGVDPQGAMGAPGAYYMQPGAAMMMPAMMPGATMMMPAAPMMGVPGPMWGAPQAYGAPQGALGGPRQSRGQQQGYSKEAEGGYYSGYPPYAHPSQ